MSQRKKRRWTAEEKLRVVLAGMEPGVGVSELCLREGVHPTQYYSWRKTLLSSAGRVFNSQTEKVSAKEQRMESELSRCKNVIAEITAENLDLKKTFSD